MIYFVEAVWAGLVKIGFTDQALEDRVRQLQTASPHPLRAIHHHPGGIDFERGLHERFAHLRQGGEWFILSPEIRSYIGYSVGVQVRSEEGEIGQLRGWLSEVSRQMALDEDIIDCRDRIRRIETCLARLGAAFAPVEDEESA